MTFQFFVQYDYTFLIILQGVFEHGQYRKTQNPARKISANALLSMAFIFSPVFGRLNLLSINYCITLKSRFISKILGHFAQRFFVFSNTHDSITARDYFMKAFEHSNPRSAIKDFTFSASFKSA